ncbi:hypothetical protein OG474_26460 [Kribbella sp. NBC_01505]|uniref:hypothetical protein n=1 Tax=Kribbella sp. NBC_01505 TaxID=2903580 RepID=UPI00386683BF
MTSFPNIAVGTPGEQLPMPLGVLTIRMTGEPLTPELLNTLRSAHQTIPATL